MRQHDSTANLVYKPAETITELSTFCDVAPGDVLLTGTPAGCALRAPPRLVRNLMQLVLPEPKLWATFTRVQAQAPAVPQAGRHRPRHHRQRGRGDRPGRAAPRRRGRDRVKRSSNAIDHRIRVGRQRSARTESRIVEAALRVFAEWGPDAPVIDDFVKAAGVARGTFYNHFKRVEQLLQATSAWTTRDVLQSIEEAIAGIEGPALRFGVGLRLFFVRAQRDPVWSRFVARVWKVGGLELPVRDLDEAIRLGHFRVPGREVAAGSAVRRHPRGDASHR